MSERRPATTTKARVAVVGAGVSGLVCARGLAADGHQVVVFEKSRGVGGRMSSRVTDGGWRFDHGAQYFTAGEDRFAGEVRGWIDAGAVAEWTGRIAVASAGAIDLKPHDKKRYVGVPDMREPCRRLAEGQDTRFRTCVVQLDRVGGGWRLLAEDAAPLGEFDSVVVSCPAPQAATLLAPSPPLARAASSAEMAGCWAVMAGFDAPLDLPFDGAFVHESPLSWVARNRSKPGRAGPAEAWVLHASSEWTAANLEREPAEVAPELVAAFFHSAGVPPIEPKHVVAHRWRYALPVEPLAERCLWDHGLRLGACGDWCGGPRVEGAYLSGLELAGRLREALG